HRLQLVVQSVVFPCFVSSRGHVLRQSNTDELLDSHVHFFKFRAFHGLRVRHSSRGLEDATLEVDQRHPRVAGLRTVTGLSNALFCLWSSTGSHSQRRPGGGRGDLRIRLIVQPPERLPLIVLTPF